TLYAQARGEVGLDIAVQAALSLTRGLRRVEPQLHLDAELLEPLAEVHVHHLRARNGVVVVAVAPCEHPQLGTREVHPPRRAMVERNPRAMIVDGDRGLMTVLHCPDDVLRSPGGVAAEEHTAKRGLEGDAVHDRHSPFAEFHADVPLDPRERVLLPDG